MTAKAPDGTLYEAFCGRFEEGRVLPGLGQSSTNANPRQRYATHLGYGFNPSDVFIGKNENGKIRTSLFFRDVGSHDTAPYFFTFDSSGNAHLIISDVNITDNNELNVYSMIGDPKTGKWTDAAMLDKRGFTSWSHPWAGSNGGVVHLLWDWGDATFDKQNPHMGLFYVDWSAKGYGIKIRVVKGLIESYDAVVDPANGNLYLVAVVDHNIYFSARMADGTWRKPALLPAVPRDYVYDASIGLDGARGLIVRLSGRDGIEWSVKPQ